MEGLQRQDPKDQLTRAPIPDFMIGVASTKVPDQAPLPHHRMTTVASGGSPAARDRASRRILAAAIGLSLALHGAALWEWRTRLPPIALDEGQSPRGPDQLTARLVAKAAEPEPAVQPAPPPPPPPPPRAATPEARKPVLTAKAAPAPRIAPPLPVPEQLRPPLEPLPPLPSPPVQPTAPPTPSPSISPPVAQAYPDLAAYVAARRRARGEPASGSAGPDDPETERRDRIVAANLASINAPTFGAQKHTGGLFQITHLGSDTAEFTFFGWNRDIKRRATQRIEVRRGSAGDIRVAVVRRMIAIIREYEQEDFTWRSARLGREVRLSARLADNEGLEHFMLRDFFGSTSSLN